MKVRDAFLFILYGLTMRALPAVKPDWFPPTGCDGTSGSEIWLQIMGGLQIAIGAAGLTRILAVPRLVRWLAFRGLPEPAPVRLLQPVRVRPSLPMPVPAWTHRPAAAAASQMRRILPAYRERTASRLVRAGA